MKTTVIQGDATNLADCSRCIQETIKQFGGIDIIIANAGWTRFSNFADLGSMSDDEWNKCWHAQVLGPKKYVQEALPTFKQVGQPSIQLVLRALEADVSCGQNPEGGVMIITSSIAAQSLAGSSMPYSVTKAAQVHMMKCIAATQGPKLRINAVLPGLLLTDWGNQYSEERVKGMREAASLKKEVRLRKESTVRDMLIKGLAD